MTDKKLNMVDAGPGCDMVLVEEKSSVNADKLKTSHSSSLKQLLRNPDYRNKVWLTLWNAAVSLSLGLNAAQFGPSFLDIQLITNTDLEEAAAFFTAMQFGFLAASLAYGAFFSKMTTNLLVLTSTVGYSGLAIATPFCSIYVAMIAVRAACGFCVGILCTALNARLMRIWGSEGQVLIQMVHFCFAFGGAISPLYTAPFLAVRPNETAQFRPCDDEHLTSRDDENLTSRDGENLTSQSQGDLASSCDMTTNVHYAFGISGACLFLSAIPFLILQLKSIRNKGKDQSGLNENVAQRELPLPIYLFILALLCATFMMYCTVEFTFASFLTTFLVNEYESVTKAKATLATAIFWASFAASRFIMIFVSKLLSPVRLLYLSGILMVVAYTGFLICASLGAVDALSVFATIAGLGMSGVWGAAFSWTESELLKVTGRVSSCVSLSCSVGTMLNPLALGYLMEEVSNMWFCYILVGETVLMCFLFVFLLLFNKSFVNKRYGCLRGKEMTITVPCPESELPLKTPEDEKC